RAAAAGPPAGPRPDRSPAPAARVGLTLRGLTLAGSPATAPRAVGRTLTRLPAPAPAAARLRPAASRAPVPLVPGPGAAPPRARPRPTARRLPSRPVGLPAP